VAREAVGFIALFWAGMIAGVSVLATPAKFLAPTLSKPAALDVGRHTFETLARAEWAMAAALGIALLAGGRRWTRSLGALLAGALFLQAVWLAPALDARVSAVIAGEPLEASSHHALYAGLEAAKLALLMGLTFLSRSRPAHGNLGGVR
jgi:hypothetical protein